MHADQKVLAQKEQGVLPSVLRQWLLLPHPQAVRRAQSQLTDVLDTLEEEDRKACLPLRRILRLRERRLGR